MIPIVSVRILGVWVAADAFGFGVGLSRERAIERMYAGQFTIRGNR